jgi:hypothetical protein
MYKVYCSAVCKTIIYLGRPEPISKGNSSNLGSNVAVFWGLSVCLSVSEILGRYSPDFYIPRNMTVLSPSSFSLFLSLSAFLASSKPLQA